MEDKSRSPEEPVDKLRVGITGASGLVGSRVCEHLQAAGHDVVRLVRRQADAAKDEVRWRPEQGEIDAAGLDGVDAVVHLAGENLFGYWTKAKKQRILESRRRGTELISRTLAALEKTPRVLVSASAVGYYGDTGDRVVDERDRASDDSFLAKVCHAWEEAT
jgi:uncharacterized protein